MKLGLIGTGKQGQRYLLEKNGGRHIVRSGSRSIDYEGLDGVIIATHPAGHKKLALECIERGLPVLVEKPLALTLADCMDIIDRADAKGVPLLVAHLDTWAAPWLQGPTPGAYCVVTHLPNERDYSVWLDWAPHALALLAKVGACDYRNVVMRPHEPGQLHGLTLYAQRGQPIYERRGTSGLEATPMALAVRDLMFGRHDYNVQRRIYQALFAAEEHGQGSK